MYTPRILLCGDLQNFLAATQERAIEVVGRISFRGAAERGNLTIPSDVDYLERQPLNADEFQIYLNGAEISFDDLRGLLDGAADYIVFDDANEMLARFNELYRLGLRDKFITRDTLLRYAADNFYSVMNNKSLVKILRDGDFVHVFDADFFFAKNDFACTSFAYGLQIETVGSADDFPLLENLYAKIYATTDACRFRHYDALLLTAERKPADFIDALIDTDGLSENILTFVRKNSALENWLTANENIFAEDKRFAAINGNWTLLKKFARADFCVYVVTHKDAKLDALPEGYRIIHAGRVTATEKFGYAGDDTGDNISALNRYLNEITALYWIWKNTRHTIIGLNHYRRFFTESDDSSFAVEKILSRETAEKILRNCDMIIVTGDFFTLTQHDLKTLVCGDDLNTFVEKIFRKHISRKQPDYLDDVHHAAENFRRLLRVAVFVYNRRDGRNYCPNEHCANRQPAQISRRRADCRAAFIGLAYEKSSATEKLADTLPRRRLERLILFEIYSASAFMREREKIFCRTQRACCRSRRGNFIQGRGGARRIYHAG